MSFFILLLSILIPALIGEISEAIKELNEIFRKKVLLQ